MRSRVVKFLLKGVIEILSSKFKLGRLKLHEDKVDNSTCIRCLYPPLMVAYWHIWCGAIVLSMQLGRPRPEFGIKQYNPRTFVVYKCLVEG